VISALARHDDVPIEPVLCAYWPKRARGTPRVALRLYRRARDYAIAREDGVITEAAAHAA
jgi:Holliday junction DNA helicase RuvB